jgi:hypothetical protein
MGRRASAGEQQWVEVEGVTGSIQLHLDVGAEGRKRCTTCCAGPVKTIEPLGASEIAGRLLAQCGRQHLRLDLRNTRGSKQLGVSKSKPWRRAVTMGGDLANRNQSERVPVKPPFEGGL